MNSLLIPRRALPLIVFQRTEYLEKRLHLLGRVVRRLPILHRFFVYLKSILYAAEVRELFTRDMRAEFDAIRPFLPSTASAILDIGSGVGGVDVFLGEYYKNEVDIYLLDKTAVDRRVFYKFESRGSFYNDMSLAQELLVQNGMPRERIHLQEATDDNRILFEARFDVVLSLISWGFHYPVGTYLPAVYSALKPGGVLLLDVRAGTDGEKEIERVFGNCEIISRRGKIVKIRATKKG